MRSTLIMAMVLAAVTASVSAQSPGIKPEVRPFAGASIPLGAQRDLFKSAPMFGLQAALELKPTLHVLGSFGWIAGENKYAGFQNDVNVFAYDVGIEFSAVHEWNDGWLFRPFVGVGGGARTYAYKAPGLADRTCTAGYGSVGTEFQLGRGAIRLEGRDNLFCYRSPVFGVTSKTRNELGVSLGFAYHIK